MSLTLNGHPRNRYESCEPVLQRTPLSAKLSGTLLASWPSMFVPISLIDVPAAMVALSDVAATVTSSPRCCQVPFQPPDRDCSPPLRSNLRVHRVMSVLPVLPIDSDTVAPFA